MAFDPNGMCMDLLRSCYKGKMRYVQGDTSQLVDVVWSFCKKTALPFPVPHAFGSQNWDTVHPTPTDLGDDANSPRQWSNGRPRNSSDGTKYAGPLEYFENGQPSGATPLPRGVSGTPVECLQPPFGLAKGGQLVRVKSAVGGLKKGGKTANTITPGIACPFCVGVTPKFPTITTAGATGNQSVFNGTFQCNQTLACLWRHLSVGGDSITITRGFTGTWNVAFFKNITGETANYSVHTADCVTPVAINFVNQTGAGTWPATVAINFN